MKAPPRHTAPSGRNAWFMTRKAILQATTKKATPIAQQNGGCTSDNVSVSCIPSLPLVHTHVLDRELHVSARIQTHRSCSRDRQSLGLPLSRSLSKRHSSNGSDSRRNGLRMFVVYAAALVNTRRHASPSSMAETDRSSTTMSRRDEAVHVKQAR